MTINTLAVTLCLLFCSFDARSEPREPREPREVNPRVCNAILVDKCVKEHHTHAELGRSWIAGLEPVIHAHEARLATIGKHFSSLSVEKNSFLAEENMLSAELDFLREKNKKAPRWVLGGKISLEDFFRMHPLHREWRERYPEERAKRLSNALADSKLKKIDLIARISKIELERSRLDNEYQSVVSQKNSWLAATKSHDEMCNKGCREQLCAPRD